MYIQIIVYHNAPSKIDMPLICNGLAQQQYMYYSPQNSQYLFIIAIQLSNNKS